MTLTKIQNLTLEDAQEILIRLHNSQDLTKFIVNSFGERKESFIVSLGHEPFKYSGSPGEIIAHLLYMLQICCKEFGLKFNQVLLQGMDDVIS